MNIRTTKCDQCKKEVCVADDHPLAKARGFIVLRMAFKPIMDPTLVYYGDVDLCSVECLENYIAAYKAKRPYEP